MTTTNICDYGCGRTASNKLKNGKLCCSKNYQSCPAVRRRNSSSKKGVAQKWKNGHPKGFSGHIPWNKGSKTNDETKRKISESLIGRSKGTASTKSEELERRRKISESMKRNPACGGLRKGSGRGKKGRYSGIWCDSSWELAWVIYCIDHNIEFRRNWERFEYEYEGRIHNYTPDFVLGNSTYVEIKGWLDDKSRAKIGSFEHNLVVLTKKEMKKYIDYVESKYGTSYTDLYE